MSIAMPPRGIALAQKLQSTVAKNQAWFTEQLKRAKPGQPLAYHPNLGLTAAEYDEFLILAKKKTLLKTGQAPLKVVHLGGDRFQLSAKKALAPLDGITLDLAKSQVKTLRGTCDKIDRIKTPDTHAFPWDGYVWETITPLDVKNSKGRVLQFHIGQLRGTQTGIIFYKAIGLEKQTVRLIITYPLAKATSDR